MAQSRTAGQDSVADPDRWLDQHGDALYRYALVRLRDPDQAAELVQETFLEAYRSRGAFTGMSSERTWLVGILRHRVIDHIRRLRRRRERQGDDATTFEDVERRYFGGRGTWRTRPAPWGDRPEDALERREFWDVLRDCLSRLPPSLAGAFYLRELDGLGSDEICLAVGITPANLWARLHRARLLLRDCLERHWFCERKPPHPARTDSSSPNPPGTAP